MLWMLAWPSHNDTFRMSPVGLQRVHRARVPQHVRRYPFPEHRRRSPPRGFDVLRQTMSEAMPAHGEAARVEEQMLVSTGWPEPPASLEAAFYPRYGIIQVEEWHSSDRLHGTVRAPRSAQIRALKWR